MDILDKWCFSVFTQLASTQFFSVEYYLSLGGSRHRKAAPKAMVSSLYATQKYVRHRAELVYLLLFLICRRLWNA